MDGIIATSITILGFDNAFPLTKLGNILKLSVNALSSSINAELPFSIDNIGLPFTTVITPIKLRVLTSDDYYRLN